MLPDAKTRFTRDLETISAAFNTSQMVILAGPPGIGKNHLLQAYVAEHTQRSSSVLFFNSANSDSLDWGPGSLVCVSDLDQLSAETLLYLSDAATAAPIRILATLTTRASAPAPITAGHAASASPELAQLLNLAQTISVNSYVPDDLARVLHAHSSLPLDVRTLERLVELSWGRPGWAVRLLNAIHEMPDLRSLLRKPVLESALSQYFADLAHDPAILNLDLPANTISDAIVLAEIGPRSFSGVLDLIGLTNAHELISAGLLERAPGSDERWGIPLVRTPSLLAASDHTNLTASYERIVTKLLDQEQFGLPLSETEERVCSFALMNIASFSHIPHNNETSLLTRRMRRLLCFGQAEPAKDVMLRLGRAGSALCQLTKARLLTLMQDTNAGLQSLLFSNDHIGNCALPINNDEHRIGLIFLRAQLSSATETPYHADDEALPEGEDWANTFTVIRAWNHTGPIAKDHAVLRRVAQDHPRAEIQLLAELLCELDAKSRGVHTDVLHAHRFVQRLTEVFQRYSERIDSREKLDDLLITLVVGYQLLSLYDPTPIQNLALTSQFVQRLSGDREHLVWISHLAAARQALHCGDIVRFELEIGRFSSSLPRFLPVRLRSYVHEFVRAAADGHARVSRNYASHLVCYFAGSVDGAAHFPRVSATETVESLAAAPALSVMGAHLAASTDRNPAALRRVAARLAELQLWGPARQALHDALAIYTSRRASGKCAEVEADLEHLRNAMLHRVTWLSPLITEKSVFALLTRREIETALQVAHGKSNLEIATTLQCSVRTIESHISNARAKLGARNRTELAEWIRRSDAARGESAAHQATPRARTSSGSRAARVSTL